MKPALAFLAAVLPACAQLAFYDGERRLDVQHALGTVAAGDPLEMRLRLKNVSGAPVLVRTLGVAGAGFHLASAPALPASLAPGGAFDFTLAFEAAGSGSFSAVLSAGNTFVLLSITAAAAPVLVFDADFGTVERGGEARRRVLLENRERRPLTVGAVVVTGAGFSAEDVPPPALSLPPGGQAGFDLVCRPRSLGPMQGSVQVGLRRAAMRATVVEPPLPVPELVVTLPRAESGQQGRIDVTLASASRTRGTGELRLDFVPAGGLGLDSSIMLSNSARSVPLRVEEGDMAARIGERASIEFQTGSTAGEIRLALQLGPHKLERTIDIAPSVVSVARAQAQRADGAVDVRVSGLDNTRAAGRLTFTFYDRKGAVVPPGAIQVDASEIFRRYFSEGSGAFQLRASFPVNGPADQLESVETEITNPIGTVRTGRIRF